MKGISSPTAKEKIDEYGAELPFVPASDSSLPSLCSDSDPSDSCACAQTWHNTSGSARPPDIDSCQLGSSSCSSGAPLPFKQSQGDFSASASGSPTSPSLKQKETQSKTVFLNGKSAVLLSMPETVISMTRAAEKSFKNYVIALRPWSFTASLTPVLLGSTLAYKVFGHFNVWICLLVCLTALSVHAAGNLVNTYFDYVKGVDCKKSDDRTLVDNLLSPNDVATMGALFYFIGCAGFALCSYLSPAKMEHLAFIYFGGLSGSFLYTGGLGLKYIALGDLAIFLTFGPVTVLFAYMAQGGTLSWMPILYTLPLALNTEAILHANNTRDMDTDRAAGIVTLAIIFGKTGSYMLLTFLLFMPYITLAVFALNFSKWFILPLLTVFSAFNCERMFRRKELATLPVKIALLNLQLGLLYIVAFFLADKSVMPGFV